MMLMMMKSRLVSLSVACALLFGVAAPLAASAAVVRAPSFIDWFVRHLARVLSELDLDAAQQQKVAGAKRALTKVIDAAIESERARVKRIRELFAAATMRVEDWETASAARRAKSRELEKKLRHEARLLLVALHGILRPEQRHKVVDLWGSQVERRSYRYERPLQ